MTETASPFATLPPDRMPTGMAKTPAKGIAKGKAPGRWAMLNAFTDDIAGTLTPAAVLTWLILFRDTQRTGTAKTGQTDLARRAGVSDRAIRAALTELEDRELVEVIRRGGIHRGPSVYRVKLAPSKRK